MVLPYRPRALSAWASLCLMCSCGGGTVQSDADFSDPATTLAEDPGPSPQDAPDPEPNDTAPDDPVDDIDPPVDDTDPVDTDPVDTDPIDTDPVDTDPVDTDPVDTDPPPARPLAITTFNVGLVPNVIPLSEERVTPVAAALADHEADVLCIQEAWRAEDREALRIAAASRFPWWMDSPDHQKYAEAGTAACTTGELADVAACVTWECLFSDDEFLPCALEYCAGEVETLAVEAPVCAAALFAQAGRPATDALDIEDELLELNSEVGLFVFGGSSGLLLLSRYELRDTQVLDFFDITTTSRRAALFATIELDGVAHHVACTHLTSNLDGQLPYTGDFDSWMSEALAQAGSLVEFADRYAPEDPVIFAGDFNCSVANATTGTEADAAGVCTTLTLNGFVDPAADVLPCSFCADNLINQMNGTLSDVRDLLLDHVFTRGPHTGSAAVERTLDQEINIAGTAAHLSDHYGVTVTLRAR